MISGQVIGSPAAAIAGVRAELSTELRGNIESASANLQGELREQIAAAGLGARLANTWRRRVYPESAAATVSPAALVWSKAASIVRAYNDGTVIAGKRGQMLAIPTDLVPRVGNRRMTPQQVAARFGALRPVKARGGKVLLVLEHVLVGKRGVRKPNANRFKSSAAKNVVMFILVRQVRVRKRLDIEAAAAAAQAALGSGE